MTSPIMECGDLSPLSFRRPGPSGEVAALQKSWFVCS